MKIPSVHESIENIFLRRNPQCKREELNWRADGRLEWVCKRGIGHTVFSMEDYWTHGCDGCCKDLVKFGIEFHVPKVNANSVQDGMKQGSVPQDSGMKQESCRPKEDEDDNK